MTTTDQPTPAQARPEEQAALHPYWCDDCGGKSPFAIPGSPIDHSPDCSRHGEDAMEVYKQAVEYVKATGKAIR